MRRRGYSLLIDAPLRCSQIMRTGLKAVVKELQDVRQHAALMRSDFGVPGAP